MSTTATDLTRRYIDLVSAKDLQHLDGLFADGLIARTGGQSFGKQEWIQALRQLTTALERNEIRHLYGDDTTAVVVYDFVTDTSAGAVPCVEVVEVADGAITGIELIFERLHWDEVMAAIRERLAPVS